MHSEDELVLNFCDNANSDNVIKLLEKLQKKYGRIFIICNNASAQKSKRIQEYLGKMLGKARTVVSTFIHSATQSNQDGMA